MNYGKKSLKEQKIINNYLRYYPHIREGEHLLKRGLSIT